MLKKEDLLKFNCKHLETTVLGPVMSPYPYQTIWRLGLFVLLTFFFFCLFAISWATPEAYGGSQARGRIRAVAPRLRQSHSNAGSELRLQPTPQAAQGNARSLTH